MGKIYLGIDHSLTGTGIAILGDKGGLIALETVRSEPQGSTVRMRLWRFRGLSDNVSEVVQRYIGNGVSIGVCCFEGYSFGSNKAQHSAIIESGYEVRSRMVSLVTGEIFEVPPSTLKKFACGKGNADKSAVVSAMTKRHNVEFGNDNEADAYALARVAYCIGESVDPGTEAARQVLAVVTGGQEKKTKKPRKVVVGA